MKQLCLCVEQHLKENTAYFQVPGLSVCVCARACMCAHMRARASERMALFSSEGIPFFIQARDSKCDCLCWRVPASMRMGWVRLKTHLCQWTFTVQTTTPGDSGLVVWARLSWRYFSRLAWVTHGCRQSAGRLGAGWSPIVSLPCQTVDWGGKSVCKSLASSRLSYWILLKIFFCLFLVFLEAQVAHDS